MVEVDPWRARYPAPAKLNLFLHVVGRRSDGYHLLQTAFRLIDLCDWLRFTPRGDGRVTLARPVAGVAEDDNLVVRAARLLQSGGGAGVEIDLEKNIPIGGGLGGGSSDCATTLAALNRLWGLRLPPERLPQPALTPPPHLPFFLFRPNPSRQ